MVTRPTLWGFNGVRTHAAASSANEQVAFVTGASRGLGLEYVRQLLQRPGQQ